MNEREQSAEQMLRSRSQNCPLILMFILSIVAGVPGPQPRTASVVRSHWLCGSLEDKTIMKLDGNNTKESLWADSQTHCCFHPSSLSYAFVSKHKFAPSSLSCWLRFFRVCQWKKISCTDNLRVLRHRKDLCLFYYANGLKLGSLSSKKGTVRAK